jgi:GTP1/Obg family GTP-binding protein
MSELWKAYDRIKELELQVKTKDALLAQAVKFYDEYIDILVDELNEVVSLACVHGWKTTRYEVGQSYRSRIFILKKMIAEATK